MTALWQPPGETVPACIAHWARVTPDAPALFGIAGDRLSYAQLWSFMERLRHDLGAVSIRYPNRVVLAMPDGVMQAAVLLASMRAAITTPVNPDLPPPEAAAVLNAVAPRAVVAPRGMATAFRDAAAAAGIAVLDVDETGMLSAGDVGLGETTAYREPQPEDLALILLTSGTTERPRRVPVTHAALLEVCALRTRIRELTPADRGLNSAPASFVVGVSRTVEAVISGGSAIVATAADVLAFPEKVRDLRPTWAWFGPALLESIVSAAAKNTAFGEWRLRMVRCGGARLRPDLAARAEALWDVPALIGYGMTEVLGYIAAEEHVDRVPRQPGSVGQVRPGLPVTIRSAAGDALPPGQPGEITVFPGRLFTGYLDDPAATASAFFSGGWFRTGDLGYLDGDGYLYVTGRAREMINRGGEKIAPHEIDDILRTHPAVADAAAFALPHVRLGEDVAVAVVVRGNTPLTARELRRWIALRVAPHKIPRKIWFVSELPRTASGKVQRAALTARFGPADG